LIRTFKVNLCRSLAAIAAVAALAACATHAPPKDDAFSWPEEKPVEPNGAIYRSDHEVAMWDNPTARNVGDIIMIRLVESTAAQKSSSTNTSKTTKAALPGPTVFGKPVTFHGNEILSGSMGNDSSFAGAGDSKQSNSLVGDITVTVVKRLPNGNLLVRGQKWLTLNQGQEFVRIQGVVRPVDVQPDNSIASSRVADARIGYGAKGALADANKPGWLSRFFNSPLMPF
jgi:flagellar L-ring protein precursor FlgH